MKKILLFTLFASFVSISEIDAQKKKAVEPEITITPQEAIDNYDFATAQEILDDEITRLTKKRKPTEDLEVLLELAEKREAIMQATEKVVFIDSLIVSKKDLLGNIKISSECGSILSYSDYFKKKDNTGCTVFKSQLGNQVFFAHPTKNNTIKLYSSTLIGNKWTEAEPLRGLDETDSLQNYPFMLTDGATLYFAADNPEGLGGYDIYMTRYDADEKTFLTPENMGMPFNSPANDYLYAIDEYNNLGWFVTDRNQEEGNVCIYTFIPNTKRSIYNEEEIGTEKLARFARITSIRETWTDAETVKQALARLEQTRKGNASEQKAPEFFFVLNDQKTCTHLTDFKVKEAQQQVQSWAVNQKNLEKSEAELTQLRNQYASASAAQKEQYAPQIRLLENKVEELFSIMKTQEKTIRKLELGQ